MDYYLVDFENVGVSGIKNFLETYKGNLSFKDSLIIFYSENCKNISLDTLERIFALGLSIRVFNTP